MARNRQGQRIRITGRARVRVRTDAYAVIGAFLIGVGPGAPVQPCPKHRELSLNLYIPRAKALRVAGEVLLPLVATSTVPSSKPT